MFIIYLFCLIIFISVLVDILLDINLIRSIKKGIKLSGKIVKIRYSIDGKRKVGRPHVSIKLNGKKQIFPAIVFYNSYKIDDNVTVYYNNKVFSDFVLIYKKKEYYLSIIFALLVYVVGILFLLQYLHLSLYDSFGDVYDKNKIIIFLSIIVFSSIIATIIAKAFYKNKYSLKPGDVIVTNPIKDKEFNKYSNLEISLYKNRISEKNDNKITGR